MYPFKFLSSHTRNRSPYGLQSITLSLQPVFIPLLTLIRQPGCCKTRAIWSRLNGGVHGETEGDPGLR
jgi:hypothetical protein